MMNHKILRLTAFLIIGALLLLMVGCVGGTTKASTFYLLKAMPESGATMQPGGMTVVLGPVTVPTYLKRPQIAITADDHRLHVDQFNRWAEPLGESVERVLLENLAILLTTANVYPYPQLRKGAIDYQVEVTLRRFSADSGGQATLVAYWSIVGNDGQTLLPRRRSVITEQAAAKDLDAVVAAQNKTLQALSREISTAIQDLR